MLCEIHKAVSLIIRCEQFMRGLWFLIVAWGNETSIVCLVSSQHFRHVYLEPGAVSDLSFGSAHLLRKKEVVDEWLGEDLCQSHEADSAIEDVIELKEVLRILATNSKDRVHWRGRWGSVYVGGVVGQSFGLERRLEEMMNELLGKMSKEVVIESLGEECRRAHKLDSSRMSSNLVLRILAANSETWVYWRGWWNSAHVGGDVEGDASFGSEKRLKEARRWIDYLLGYRALRSPQGKFFVWACHRSRKRPWVGS